MPFNVAPGGGLVGLPPWPAGQYVFPIGSNQPTATSIGNNVMRAGPAVVPYPASIDRLAVEVTAAGEAGSVLRLGVYADAGAKPGALLIDAGTVPGDVVATAELTVAVTLPAGIVWFATVTQNAPTTQPQLRCVTGAPVVAVGLGVSLPGAGAGIAGITQGAVSGALPASAAPTGAGGVVPRPLVRVVA